MRSKFISNAILIALISQIGLGTGCAWWHRHFGPQTHAGYNADGTKISDPGALNGKPITGPGGDLNMGARPDGNYTTGQFTPVYFDYDSAKIKPSEFAKVEAVAAVLKGNSKKVVVEGNTDERGTAEYNRALGERRAQAGREALIKLGIDGGRISTASYGKDHPVEPSHDDTAWSRNRRDEFGIAQ